MRKLTVFNHVSLDGFFVDATGSMSWAKAGSNDPEWSAFAQENASGGGTLLFGRITYELMASYWPTPLALEHDPAVAKHLNELPKVVFSRTLKKASWNNTTLVNDDVVAAIRRMKAEPGSGMVILGSGSLVSPLARAGLIDGYELAVNPIVLGQGRSIFDGIKEHLSLRLTRSRVFGNGNAYLCYEPTA